MLQQGDVAPELGLPDSDGGTVRLVSMRGHPVVIYFYPRDDTSGCTREALEFNALSRDFVRLGIPLIGASPDTEASHRKFKEKHGLTLRLAADTEKRAAQAYGVWVEKSMYGRKYMGVERSTFLIGADGRLARIWRKVKVPGHAEAVLAAARELVGGNG
ncbi:MAG: peroxiredoxin [Pseudomonadota bacterium]|nr:peroxiredoxin [Pseudomonadota bacterium]